MASCISLCSVSSRTSYMSSNFSSLLYNFGLTLLPPVNTTDSTLSSKYSLKYFVLFGTSCINKPKLSKNSTYSKAILFLSSL